MTIRKNKWVLLGKCEIMSGSAIRDLEPTIRPRASSLKSLNRKIRIRPPVKEAYMWLDMIGCASLGEGFSFSYNLSGLQIINGWIGALWWKGKQDDGKRLLWFLLTLGRSCKWASRLSSILLVFQVNDTCWLSSW